MIYIIVGLGGTIGAILRYLVGNIFKKFTEKHGIVTFFINITGSFLIGYFSTRQIPEEFRCFLMAGLLGGFTTYSTFMSDIVKYLRERKHFEAFVYMFFFYIFRDNSCWTGHCFSKWYMESLDF
ncbi:fluoride efflux transporter FluC [Dictyoglomus thermophilum]|uniref:fluoride efflux transporter FluC n=1 Tax=Dictyoglomus thermophilum TaxID=14 RepID=UPI001CA4668C|nr:CrcB family protein [Dictyoglomus thermophilum]